jgi:hypothetical protein
MISGTLLIQVNLKNSIINSTLWNQDLIRRTRMILTNFKIRFYLTIFTRMRKIYINQRLYQSKWQFTLLGKLLATKRLLMAKANTPAKSHA